MMRDTVNSQPDKEKQNVYNNVGANGYSGRFIPDRATVAVVRPKTSEAVTRRKIRGDVTRGISQGRLADKARHQSKPAILIG